MRFLYEVVKEDKSLVFPIKEKDAVAQRAELPEIPLNMFDERRSESCSVEGERFHVGEDFLAIDAAGLVGLCFFGKRIEMCFDL